MPHINPNGLGRQRETPERKILILCLLVFLFSTVDLGAAQEMTLRNRLKIKKKSQLEISEESEEYTLEKIEVLSKKRKHLILDIRRFLGEARSEEQKAELNLRLGSLFMEDYHSGLAKAQSVFEKQLEEYNQNPRKKKIRPPQIDNSESMASLERARVIYKDLVLRLPKHPRRDEMLYSLAVASLDRGLVNEGMNYFKKLSNETPNSRYMNDALVQLGDHYFERNNYREAETYYDKILTKKYRPLRAYATYKKGWCAYNQGKLQVALSCMKWVVLNEEAESSEAPLRVKNEALRDITLPFVDLKLANESITFFKQFGELHARRGLETMALLYFESGDFKNSILLWETLLSMSNHHAKNPHYEVSIVESLSLRNDQASAVNRLFNRMPNYLENSNWYEIHSNQPKIVQEALRTFEDTARKYAFQFHAEAQKTKNRDLYDLSKKIYMKYLEYFPNTQNAPQIRFYLAEILYKQEDYLTAADQYFQLYKNPHVGNLKLDAIRNALLALDRRMNADRKKLGLGEMTPRSGTKLKGEGVQEITPFTEIEGKFVDISTEYLTQYPKMKDAPDVMYEQAYLQYIHFDFPRSYKSFWTFLLTYSNHPAAYPSAHLTLDILNRRKDYPKLITAAQKILQTPTLSKPSFKAEVGDILRKAELKQIALMEEKNQFKEAAVGYMQYTRTYGVQDETLFEKALFNASVNYTKASLFMNAVETQEHFLRRFPNSPLREGILIQVAKTHENLANFEKAAQFYEQFSREFPRNTQAHNAMRLAGLFHWGSGNPARAEKVLVALLSLASSESERMMFERDLLDLYESSGNSERVLGIFRKHLLKRGLPLSEYLTLSLKVTEIQAKRTGKLQGSVMKSLSKTVRKNLKELSKSNPIGTAKVLFWSTNQDELEFYNVRLTLPQQRLEANMKQKLQRMKALEKDYLGITSLGSGEYGLGSLFKTAAAYRHMAQAVVNAPVPAELSAEQTEMYRKELTKSIVKPFNEKTLALVTQCLEKSQELNLLSHWTSECYALAGELQPEQYPRVRTLYLPPLQTALLLPDTESKIEAGNLPSFSLPFYLSQLFQASPERRTASLGEMPDPFLGDLRNSSDLGSLIPMPMNYRNLSDERRTSLLRALEDRKPPTLKEVSFAYLSLLRLLAPEKALPIVLQAIHRDPGNIALHNLLGLTHFELNNLSAAKVTWLTLQARAGKTAAILINLGVLAHREDKELMAIDYFQQASLLEKSQEAFSNLGFIALKYRNGFEARKYFEGAQSIDDSPTQVGLAVAHIQTRELEQAKDRLAELMQKFKQDPYARLSLAYLLLDGEREQEVARKVLSEYIEQQSLENDPQFRRALQETVDINTSGGVLPTIGP